MAKNNKVICGPIILCGIILLTGGSLILASIFASSDSDFPYGRPVVALAGSAFALAGLSIATAVIPKRRIRDILQSFMGALLLTAFAGAPLSMLLHVQKIEVILLSSFIITGMLAVAAWYVFVKNLAGRTPAIFIISGIIAALVALTGIHFFGPDPLPPEKVKGEVDSDKYFEEKNGF